MSDGRNFKAWIGIVVADRELKSRLVKCYVKELLPTMNGGLGDATKEEEFELEDLLNEGVIHGNVKTTNCITAEWLGETNQSFPPDVVRGEQVAVFRYADSDIFYWHSLGRDDNLRRGELHRISVSDDMAVVKDLNDENTYFIELDTRVGKRIRVKTSKSDGENYQYELLFNAKEDYVTLNDDVGNRIDLHSAIPRIRLENSDGTWTELNQRDINFFAPQHITMTAVKDITLQATTISLLASDKINLRATNSVNITAPKINNTGDTNIDGDVSIKGDTSFDGGVSMGGGSSGDTQAVINGELQINGNITFTGTIDGPDGSWH